MKTFDALLFVCLCSSASGQEKPIVSVSFGYIYLNADQHNAPRADLNGWYAIPQYHIRKNWSATGEFTNFYGSPLGQSTNIHGYTGGPLYGITIGKRLSPFVFGEVGDVRTSAAGKVENSFAFVAGVGANIKIVNRISLQIIPGDYVLTKSSGGVLHNYAAQVGLAVDVWSK